MDQPNSREIHGGYTLIEAIVSLGIVILLAGLLIPAVFCSREAARRTQCRNNLKQIGLGFFNYHETYSQFPMGFVFGNEGVYKGWGWGITTVPFLDANNFAMWVKFESGLQLEYANPRINPRMTVYRCPTDQGSDKVEHVFIVSNNVQGGVVTTATLDAVKTFSRSNYFAVAGYLQAAAGGIEHDASGNPTQAGLHMNAGSLGHSGSSPTPERRYCDTKNFGGIFGQNSTTSIGDIKDGLANVIMVGERATPDNHAKHAIGHGTWLGVPDCTTAAGLAMALGDTSVKLNLGGFQPAETTGFSSLHARGTFFLFADGSVKFLSNNIDIAVYRDLSTINDGRKIPSFE